MATCTSDDLTPVLREIIGIGQTLHLDFEGDGVRAWADISPAAFPHFANFTIGPIARLDVAGKWELDPTIEFSKSPVAISRVAFYLRHFGLSDVRWTATRSEESSESVFLPKRKRPARRTLWVYFFKAVGAPYVKIGRSLNVSYRRLSLECGCPYELIELGRVRWNRFREAALHRRFAHLRFRAEWFNETPELLQFIEENREHRP